MDEDGPMLGVGFAIDFHDSFGRLRSLDDLVGTTQANIFREFQKMEAAAKGALDLRGATAQVTTFGNAASRELQAATRDIAKAETAGEALVRQLERQNSTFGKSRAELRSMKVETAALAAEQAGLSELAGRLIDNEIALLAKEAAAADAAAQARVNAAERAAQAELASLRAVNSQLAERAQLEAAIERNTGVGRARATDAGATFSALSARAAEEEARAAASAAAAEKRLADEHERLAAMVRGSHAAQMADAEAAERLRMATDPLYAATKRLNEEIAESTRLYHSGATAPAEYARQQQVLVERLNNVGIAGEAMHKSLGRGSGTLTQLSFQLNDVATMAASGAPAFQIFATQAGQIFQVAQMAEGGLKGFAAEIGNAAKAVLLFTVSNPLILGLAVAAGALAAGLKLIQNEANEGEPMKKYAESLGLSAKEMRHMTDVTVTYGDTAKAAFQLAGEAIWGAIGGGVSDTWDEMKAWLSWAAEGTGAYFNLLISRGVRAYEAIRTTWKQFPAVFGDVFFSAVNYAIEAINNLIKRSISGINSFITSSNGILGKVGLALPTLSAPQIDKVKNQYAGAADKVAKAWNGVLSEKINRDYIGDGAKAIGDRAQQIARERIRKQAEDKGYLDPEKGKTDRHAEQLAREAAAMEAQIKNLYALADAYNVSGAAALVAEARVKAESDAIKKRADIEELVERQIRLAIAQRVSDAAKSTASMRDQAAIQEQVNAQVAAGLIPAQRAADLVRDRIADLPLLAAIEVAQQRGLAVETAHATRELEFQQQARERLRVAAVNAQVETSLASSKDRLAELHEELRLIGETEEARARSMATFKAQQEVANWTGADPAKAAEYIRLQGDIAAQTVVNAQAQRNYNDELAFTADRWDLIANNVKNAARGMADAFGAAGRAIGDVAAIYADFQATQARLDADRRARVTAAGHDQVAIERANAKYALATATSQIGLFGDMTSAAKGFFKEHSAGYKAMAAAEKTFRAIELAMSVQAMIQNALETAGVVTNAAVKATAEGTAGIAKQSQLPFPLNIVAMGATAAALIAAGISVIGSFGGGSKNTLPKANDGTGTVLGDASAKSESIKRSIDALKEVDTTMLTYSRQMAASLRSIEDQIGGFAALVLRTGDVNANGDVAQGFKPNAIGSALGAIPLVGGILKGLFGTKTKVVGSGLFGDNQTLGDILSGGFDASYYSDVQKKKKLFGITTSTKYSTKYTDADAGLENQFTLILKQFDDAILAAAGPLGESTDAIKSKLNGFVVDIGKIDLQGLTGDEIEEKLSAVFGAAADKMATAAFPGIERFQKAGEGLFETLVRVSSTVESVSSSLGLLSSSAATMSIDAKLTLADQFDSVSDFTSAIGAYFDAYYSKEEQAAAKTRQFAQVFDSLGLAMPSTLAGFRSLVEAQDLTTAAGQSTYATLLQLAPAFADLQTAMNGAKSAADILSEQQDLQRQLLELQGDTAAIRALDLAKIDPSNRALQEQVWALQDAKDAANAAEQLRQAWTSVGDSIMDEVNRIRGLTDGSSAGSFALLQGQFNAATTAARAGDQDAAGKLVGLSQSLLTVAGNTATSRQELERVKAQVAASLEGTYALIGAITGASNPSSTVAALSAAATATEAAGGTAPNTDELGDELRAVRAELVQLRSDVNSGTAAIASNTGRIATKLDDVTAEAGGNAISVAAA